MPSSSETLKYAIKCFGVFKAEDDDWWMRYNKSTGQQTLQVTIIIGISISDIYL